MDPYLSTIYIFAGNFQIKGFLFCAGQILPLSQNTALFSLLGTNFGGNGQNTFGLPDLRGRSTIGQGQGPGLTEYVIGESLGSESVSILQSQMVAHTHAVNASTTAGTLPTPAGNFFSEVIEGSGPHATHSLFYNSGPANVTLPVNTIGVAGGSQPFSNMQPLLTLTPLIATSGIFPARN